MDYLYISVKAFTSIVVLFILTKLMGQRQVSQLSMFDYTVGITIGSIAAEMASSLDKNSLIFIVAMVIYALVAVFISYITTKSMKARKILTGMPLVLIEKGKIIRENLKKSKIDLDDLFQESRVAGYFDISDINYAVLESNGRISFLPKGDYKALTPHDIKQKIIDKGLCLNLIMDGKINYQNLKYIKKSKNWLITRINKLGYKNISDIFLLTIDQNENIKIFEMKIKHIIDNLQ